MILDMIIKKIPKAIMTRKESNEKPKSIETFFIEIAFDFTTAIVAYL
jgi:hypothetical protein